MSRERVGSRRLAQLQTELSDRELAIIAQVGDLRLMTSRQIEAVHFGPERHASGVTATRTCRRVLERLVEHHLLVRLERRVGGVRAGSHAAIYALGPVGQRVLELDSPRRRFREPTLPFVDHTLAIGQLVVALTLAARQGLCELLAVEAEPACWRSFSALSGRQVLRPDLFVALGVGDYEHRWFVEIDRGSESLPVVLRKCRYYDAYRSSGREQAEHGVFPRTCWVVPDTPRATRLQQGVSSAQDLSDRMFVVSVTEGALETLIGSPA